MSKKKPKESEWLEKDSIVTIKRKSFHCHCGCNVFRRHRVNKNRWKCNSCDEVFAGD